MKLDSMLGFTRELALASAEIIQRYYGQSDMGLEMKADESPVTLADRLAEEQMRRMILERYPDHGIVGEEFGSTRTDAEFVWVLDPIDGTKSFISHVPLFGTLIGLLHHGRPVLGCIHQPILRQLMLGDGKTTTLNGEPVRVRTGRSLEESTVLITDSLMVGHYQNAAGYEQLTKKARLVRTWGDCYGYLLVAAGHADVMLDPVLNSWDLLPVMPIIDGAGGRISDWQGGVAGSKTPNSAIATVPDLHPELVRLLNPQ
jgi:myo-inositol-1(or 4)-monophosphatase